MRSTGDGYGAWRKSWRKAGGVRPGRRAAGVRTRRSWSVRFVCRFTWSWRSHPLPGDVRATGGASCGRSGRRLPGGHRLGRDEVPHLPPEVETGGDEVSGGRPEEPAESAAGGLGRPLRHADCRSDGGNRHASRWTERRTTAGGRRSTVGPLFDNDPPNATVGVRDGNRPGGEAPAAGALPDATLSAAFGSGHIVSVRTTSSASARSSPMSSRTARSAAWPGRSQAERPRVWSSVIRPSRAASTASLTRGAEARP